MTDRTTRFRGGPVGTEVKGGALVLDISGIIEHHLYLAVTIFTPDCFSYSTASIELLVAHQCLSPEPASHKSRTLAGVVCETKHSMVQEFFAEFRAIWMHDPGTILALKQEWQTCFMNLVSRHFPHLECSSLLSGWGWKYFTA